MEVWLAEKTRKTGAESLLQIEIKGGIFNYLGLDCLAMTKIIIKLKQPPEGVLWKKLFLRISQNSQKNTCARVSF